MAAQKNSKLYKVTAGEYADKKAAILDFIKIKSTIADSTIVLSGNVYFIECGVFAKKANAETLKSTINLSNVQIIEM